MRFLSIWYSITSKRIRIRHITFLYPLLSPAQSIFTSLSTLTGSYIDSRSSMSWYALVCVPRWMNVLRWVMRGQKWTDKIRDPNSYSDCNWRASSQQCYCDFKWTPSRDVMDFRAIKWIPLRWTKDKKWWTIYHWKSFRRKIHQSLWNASNLFFAINFGSPHSLTPYPWSWSDSFVPCPLSTPDWIAPIGTRLIFGFVNSIIIVQITTFLKL